MQPDEQYQMQQQQQLEQQQMQQQQMQQQMEEQQKMQQQQQYQQQQMQMQQQQQQQMQPQQIQQQPQSQGFATGVPLANGAVDDGAPVKPITECSVQETLNYLKGVVGVKNRNDFKLTQACRD